MRGATIKQVALKNDASGHQPINQTIFPYACTHHSLTRLSNSHNLSPSLFAEKTRQMLQTSLHCLTFLFMIMTFSAIPLCDLNTHDELGTDLGSEVERDGEAGVTVCLTFFSLLIRPPFFQRGQVCCTSLFQGASHSFITPLPKISWLAAQFGDLPPVTQLAMG